MKLITLGRLGTRTIRQPLDPCDTRRGWTRPESPDEVVQRRVIAHLERARALLQHGDVWAQNAYARDPTGTPVDSKSTDAVRYCCSGAVYATEDPAFGSVQARSLLSRVIGNDIETWNDMAGRRKMDVIDAFDRAISAARSHLKDEPVFATNARCS